MKEMKLLVPVNCDVVSEQEQELIVGGMGPVEILGLIAAAATCIAFDYDLYHYAGEQCRRYVYPKSIPWYSKVLFMAACVDPLGWIAFNDGYNGY